jgi:hypothetical protein
LALVDPDDEIALLDEAQDYYFELEAELSELSQEVLSERGVGSNEVPNEEILRDILRNQRAKGEASEAQ